MSRQDELTIDLFAGPGGWSEGLRMLGLSDVGIELDDAACRTRTAAGHLTIRADVAAYPVEPFVGKTWGLIASPPCQDFSIAGAKAGIGGKRGQLVHEVIRWAEALTPAWLVAEQVPEVLPIWRAFAHHLRSLGYLTTCGVLDAQHYGVPQSRTRAFLLARRDRQPRLPEGTHCAVEGLWNTARLRTIGDADSRREGWTLRHIRGEGMVERHGQRPGRTANQPCFTVLAWKDSRMRWEHPDGRREPFTLADSLIFQGFPADYPVHGSTTRAQEQIGNAVPPLLAAHVLSAVTDLPLSSSEVAA